MNKREIVADILVEMRRKLDFPQMHDDERCMIIQKYASSYPTQPFSELSSVMNAKKVFLFSLALKRRGKSKCTLQNKVNSCLLCINVFEPKLSQKAI